MGSRMECTLNTNAIWVCQKRGINPQHASFKKDHSDSKRFRLPWECTLRKLPKKRGFHFLGSGGSNPEAALFRLVLGFPLGVPSPVPLS